MYRILLIEDQASTRQAADGVLRSLGHEVVAVDAAEAVGLLDAESFDVVIAGVEPPRDEVKLPNPVEVPRSLLYLARPFSMDDLVNAVTGLEERDAVRAKLKDAREELRAGAVTSPIVGRSPAMQRVLDRLAAIADSEVAVLLTGRSGTGKELLARTIHRQSSRRDRPLVTLNCAALPDTLLEAELFGYERGSFTGALQRREGRFKAADGGTLFLDEVNGLSLPAQAKILRVLQDGTFQALGSNTTLSVDVRLISATNQSLESLVAEGAFREDLYYRIKVIDIEVPPLRARQGDLPLLVEHFLLKHTRPGREPPGVTPRAWAALSQHSFPGNIRELEHAIQHALVLSSGHEIDIEHLPRDLCPTQAVPAPGTSGEIRPLPDVMREFEREYLVRALNATGGNKTQAARLLGISRKSLWDKLRRLEVSVGYDGVGNEDDYQH